MQCSRCGAAVRSGMTECPKCGAPLTQSSGGNFEVYRPPSQGYVPGGQPQQPARNYPQNDPAEQPQQDPQQRRLGSLQRRLQRTQASAPNDDDRNDARWDTPRPRPGERSQRSRPLDRSSDSHGPRRSSVSDVGNGYRDGYGERGRRSRPIDDAAAGRRGSRESDRPRSDRGDYGALDESREAGAYTPYPPYRAEPEDSREYGAYSDWDASREEPAYERRPQRNSAPNQRRPMDESAEMSVEGPAYEPPRRPTPRRRSRPMDDEQRDWNDYTNPLDDPRSPLAGGQGRRPSQGTDGRGRRGSSASVSGGSQRSSRRPADGYADYDSGYDHGYNGGEMRDRGYQGYREAENAYGAPDYPPGYPPAASAGRGPRGWDDDIGQHDDREDDYASREGWVAPGGPYPSYHPQPHGSQRRDVAFGDSVEMWQPGGGGMPAPARASAPSQSRSRRSDDMRVDPKASQKNGKRKGSGVRTALSLLTTLALIAALGVEFGPKVYHLILTRGVGTTSASQAAPTCATETTPPAQLKPPTGSTAFSTTAYTLTYPSGWQKNTVSGTTQNQCDIAFSFSQPNGVAQFNIEQAGVFSSLSDLQVIQAEAQSAQQQGSTFTEITSAATTQNIGGAVWQRREYQATTKTGVKLHLAMLAGHHKGAGYAIVLQSSDTGFSHDDTTTFEPMLRSFQFV